MKKTARAFLSLALCLLIAAGTVLSAGAQPRLVTVPLQFGSGGKFKILHITDTHLHDDNVENTMRLISLACDVEQPDLAILTGDLAPEDTFEHTAKLVDALMQAFETRKIPVAVTFGNHDSENGAYTREAVMALYNAYNCSISIDDGEILTGCGTYLIPIRGTDGAEKFNLWIFDSGDYDDEGHYANVAEDQVVWYRDESAASESRNGRKIYSLAFQHIIVPEIYDALEKVSRRTLFSYPRIYDEDTYYRFSPTATNYGMLHEKPCCGYYNHGQFDAMAERGDVLAIFTGHDHTNAFGVRYKNIDIINSLSTRYNGDTFSTQYGYRVVELDESKPDSYTTRVVRWYDFVNTSKVRKLADTREAKQMLAKIRFLGFFNKLWIGFSVFAAQILTGRTVRYPG